MNIYRDAMIENYSHMSVGEGLLHSGIYDDVPVVSPTPRYCREEGLETLSEFGWEAHCPVSLVPAGLWMEYWCSHLLGQFSAGRAKALHRWQPSSEIMPSSKSKQQWALVWSVPSISKKYLCSSPGQDIWLPSQCGFWDGARSFGGI